MSKFEVVDLGFLNDDLAQKIIKDKLNYCENVLRDYIAKSGDEKDKLLVKLSDDNTKLKDELKEFAECLKEQMEEYYECSNRCNKYITMNPLYTRCDCGAEKWVEDRNKLLEKYK